MVTKILWYTIFDGEGTLVGRRFKSTGEVVMEWKMVCKSVQKKKTYNKVDYRLIVPNFSQISNTRLGLQGYICIPSM